MVESPEEVGSSSSSATAGGGGGDGTFAKRKRTKRRFRAFSTTTATEEEEDTAHCLILLAQGCRAFREEEEEEESRKLAGATGGAEAAGGIYVYECKTCSKRFPSFQALGGHRTSHKKPRLAAADDMIGTSSASARLVVVGRFRLHECSICGSEFASGQALGGHMRRHRPAAAAAAAAATPTSSRKLEEKSVLLSLDLNLPAPPEENLVSRNNSSMAAVAFAAAAFADQRPMALVDCHY